MTIFAAGCVVYRQGSAGVELLLVHRDRYDDWTFPKGKRDEGENDRECAAREVLEETGFVGEFGAELSPSEYLVWSKKSKKGDKDRRQETKIVRWWLMKQTGGDFEPNDEVDSIRWVTLEQARESLTYERDRDLLGELDSDNLVATII